MSLAALSLLLVQQVPPPIETLPNGNTVERNIDYVGDGEERHMLDIYRRKDVKEDAPCVIFIHGGGWQNGSKDRVPRPAQTLATEGFVVVSINYRLSAAAQWPAQGHDVKAAVRFMRGSAKKYGIDADRIGVFGTSAGGHLAAFLGVTGDEKELEGSLGKFTGVSSRVQACAPCFGPTDMRKLVGTSRLASTTPVSRLLGGYPDEKTENYKTASPINYASKDDPPFQFVHGDKDAVVPLEQSEILNSALKKAGVKSDLFIMKDQAHGLAPTGFDPLVGFFKRELGS